MKPLFIPLKTEHYEAFKSGLKTREIRLYGRWNKDTCFFGRPVILSKGYGTYDRMTGRIVSFTSASFSQLGHKEQEDFLACFGEEKREARIALIGIKVNRT